MKKHSHAYVVSLFIFGSALTWATPQGVGTSIMPEPVPAVPQANTPGPDTDNTIDHGRADTPEGRNPSSVGPRFPTPSDPAHPPEMNDSRPGTAFQNEWQNNPDTMLSPTPKPTASIAPLSPVDPE